MTYDIIIALFIFCLVSALTPGPNNIMLLASGMNYGIVRTIPHMLGILVGFPSMVFLVGVGLSQIFETIPYSYETLKILSTLYLLYLAWKIATAVKPNTDIQTGKPFTFLQAATFQWINPKAWTMALSAISIYTPPEHPFYSIVIVTLAFALTAIPSTSFWTILGHKLRLLIQDEQKLRIFNITCALILIATLYPILSA